MKKIVKLLFIIIWLLVIFLFSNQDGSTSTSLTNGILEKYLFFVDSDIFFMIIRKMAHITEYFILGRQYKKGNNNCIFRYIFICM